MVTIGGEITAEGIADRQRPFSLVSSGEVMLYDQSPAYTALAWSLLVLHQAAALDEFENFYLFCAALVVKGHFL